MKNLDDPTTKWTQLMLPFDAPTGDGVIPRRDYVPAGFRQWTEADLRRFGTSLDEMAGKCFPGAFINVGDKVFFSGVAAASMSCR